MVWAPPGKMVAPGTTRARTVHCSYQPGSAGRNQALEDVMRGLGGRTYIVTGAASGIGRATAARLLDEGALVMGADLAVPPDDIAEGRDESGRWAFTHVDVTDESSVAALVGSAVEFGGSVDGVLH